MLIVRISCSGDAMLFFVFSCWFIRCLHQVSYEPLQSSYNQSKKISSDQELVLIPSYLQPMIVNETIFKMYNFSVLEAISITPSSEK